MSYSKAVTGKRLAGSLGTTSAALGPGVRPSCPHSLTHSMQYGVEGRCPEPRVRVRGELEEVTFSGASPHSNSEITVMARTRARVPACAGSGGGALSTVITGRGVGVCVALISTMGRLRLRCLAVLSRDVVGWRLVRTNRSAGGEGTYRKCAVFTHEDLNSWRPRRPLTPPPPHPAATLPGGWAGVTFPRKAKPLVEPE